MSVRLRLTLLYTVLLTLTLTIFASFVFVAMSRTLTSEIDQSIAGMANSVIRSTKISAGPYFLQEIVLPDINVFASPDTYLQVVDNNGRMVAHSKNLGFQSLPLSEDTLNDSARGSAFYETVSAGDQSIRIYNVPLVVNKQFIGILQVGRSLSPVLAVMQRLKLLILAGSFLTVVVAGLLGWFMARTAFQPVEEMITTVDAIQQSGDLSRRVVHRGSKDELGRLAGTMNEMLSRLETMYLRLKAANDAQRQFVAEVSHELRTPLTTIRGNAELLLKMGQADPETTAEALNDIAEEAQRLTNLVSGLLALARADAGNEFEMQDVNIQDLLSAVARQTRFIKEDVNFKYKENHQLDGLLIKANLDHLKQLLLILIDNAFKYTPAGGDVELAASIEKDASKGRNVNHLIHISVRDTGCGINPEEQERIFQRFYRGSDTKSQGGAGLGLAIAKWIAEQHGGTISVSSSQGRGSVFTFTLPVLS